MRGLNCIHCTQLQLHTSAQHLPSQCDASDDPTAETVGQKLNTKNLVQLKVVGKLPRNDTLFRAQEMLRYAGRDSWEPVYICTDTA